MVLPKLDFEGHPAPTKRLLAHTNGVWLFEVSEAGLTYYTVERAERTWEFSQLTSAETQFIRVVNRSCVK
jgi:hypothetical protein